MSKQPLYEPESADFTQILGFFERGNPNEAVLYSTMEGRYPGRVFTDDMANPKQAFVACGFGWGFFGGRLSDEFIASCLDACPSHIICRHNNGPSLNLPIQYSEVFERLEFRDSSHSAQNAPLDENLEFLTINAEILNKCLWKDVVLAATGTVENFLDHGIGILLTRDGDIVCEAYGLFPTSNLIEIGAITSPEFQRQGFSTLTVSELIRRCQANGYATTWTCDLDNVASQAVARNMGYRMCTPYQFIGRKR